MKAPEIAIEIHIGITPELTTIIHMTAMIMTVPMAIRVFYKIKKIKNTYVTCSEENRKSIF